MRNRLDRFEAGALAIFALVSMWVVGSDLIVQAIQERRWTHTDGFYSGDQLQYLSWIQSSAHHGLISNLFVLRATPADYFQPAIMLSALLVRLGTASWLSLMLWKPVAVVMIVLAARALVNHCLARTFDRRAALIIALLYGALTVINGQVSVFGDMMSTWQSWGYPFGLIGVALIVFGMLRYARARDAGQVVWLPGLMAAVAGMIHPWQGEMMFLIVLFAEAVRARQTVARWRRGATAGSRSVVRAALDDPTARLVALTLLLTAVPLLYYFALGHLDAVWQMSQAHARHSFTTVGVLVAAAPLLVFALLGYRGAPADFTELLVRMWLPATALLWIFGITSLGATPQHAVNGLPLALGVLAVLGVRRVGLDRIPHARSWAVAAVAVVTVPGTAYAMADAHVYTNPASGNADWITQGESSAMDYLTTDPERGGVLTTFYLGEALPGLTGRQTLVGDCLWSEPNCDARAGMVSDLIQGKLSTASARAFVANSGARFLLIPCQRHVDVARQLAPLITSTQHFGCAILYHLVNSGPAEGDLAAVKSATHT